ncbi:MAG: acyl-CoA thioesterase [Myxococcota bacterium]
MAKPDEALRDLIDHLILEGGENDVFRGHSQLSRNGRIFGGSVFAQAMRAAAATVSEREMNSAHGYFLRAGNPKLPIDYSVERIREGRSFNTRRVTARQEGKPIFELSASFHIDEPAEGHQAEVEIPSEPFGEEYEAGIQRALVGRGIEISDEELGVGPIQILIEGGLDMTPGDHTQPALRCWLRSRGPMPDEQGIHSAVLTWVSDLTILVAALHPMPYRVMSPGVQSASLDHAIWFHDDFRLDDWIYAVQEAPVFKGSRALGRALFYTRDGRLVASAVQEGLIRREVS